MYLNMLRFHQACATSQYRLPQPHTVYTNGQFVAHMFTKALFIQNYSTGGRMNNAIWGVFQA